MRILLALLLLLSAPLLPAAEWKSELFHCSAVLPSGPGWQMVEPPHLAGITTLVVVQHVGRQAAFGINIVEKTPGTDLANPAVRTVIESAIRQSGYPVIGHSKLRVGDLDWLNYPVRAGSGAQQVSGTVRFTSAGGYIFAVSMLKGGGQDAGQDADLVRAATSFRHTGGPAPETAATPATRPSLSAFPKTTAQSPVATPADAAKPDPEATPSSTSQPAAPSTDPRLFWYIGGGIVALLVFFKIIGGGRRK